MPLQSSIAGRSTRGHQRVTPEPSPSPEPSPEPSPSVFPIVVQTPVPPPPPPDFYLDPNGVTVRCPNAANLATGVVNGITYTKRNLAQLQVGS